MPITTRDQMIDALANRTSTFLVDKASLGSQAAGNHASLWTATGLPCAGAAPGTAAVCTGALAGAIPFSPPSGMGSWLASLSVASSISALSIELHDRLAHMGGLNLTLTTAQTVGVDVQTLGLPAARLGQASLAELQWWYEVYSPGGSTAANATFTVTFDDGSTGALSPLAVGGSLAAGRIFSLNTLRTAAQQNRRIRGVSSVTLSTSTGAAGNAGITVTRPLSAVFVPVANAVQTADWAQLGLPQVHADACLALVMLATTSSTGTLRGGGKIVHG
ncbi:MAG: hypothetical protein IH998_06200 [Proteobacteria bacterium]|nr:hypothetical protein [Pseudomonadota bacterium]